MNLIEINLPMIRTLCRKYKVGKLFIFGSFLNKQFNHTSDVDLVVDFKDVKLRDYADNYFDFKFALEDLFNRKIDLLESKAIHNPYLKKTIDSTKQLIYG